MSTAQLALPADEKPSRIERLPLIGGALCFNFTNTVSGLREGEHEIEHFHAYEHVLEWSVHAGVVTRLEARLLLARAASDGAGAARALHRALAVRDTIHDLFAGIAHKQAVPERLLESFNGSLSEALRHARVHGDDDGFAWGWDDLTSRLEAPLWPILRAAADVLTGGKLDRVKQCPYPHCGWLFVDLSKNKSRRWCEMSVCGNRTKARRHYMREKRVDA